MYFTCLGSENVLNYSTTTYLNVHTINLDTPLTYLLKTIQFQSTSVINKS